MPALLCETVTGDTMDQLLAARDAAAAGRGADGRADMVELRLDGVKDLDVERALYGSRRPIIATCRAAWEGGRFSDSEDERRAILARAVAAGADYVDVEWKALRQGQGRPFDELVQANRSKVVVSAHDFDGVPADLRACARSMRAIGAAVIKIAVTADRLCDTLPLREITKDGGAVVIGMGDAGVPSRLLATRFGTRWTYAGNAVAPGQMPAARMLEQFRFRSVTDRTLLYGIAGDRVLHSRVPPMHNAAFAAAGLDAVCVPLPAADFTDFLAFTDALRISGWEASNGEVELTVEELIAVVERQFESWTGRRPAPGVMREAVEQCT